MNAVTHTLKFVSGKTTCASEPGKFCRFVRTKHFGTQFECSLFDLSLFDHSYGEYEGWLARCTPCMEQFPNEEIK